MLREHCVKGERLKSILKKLSFLWVLEGSVHKSVYFYLVFKINKGINNFVDEIEEIFPLKLSIISIVFPLTKNLKLIYALLSNVNCRAEGYLF